MRKSLLILLFLLPACEGGGMPIDSKTLLSGLEGPKVPSVDDTMMEAAKNAEKQGDYRLAAQFYQQMLDKQPDNAEVAQSLADALRRSGEFDHAITLYDLLLQKSPDALAPKEGKALALLAKGDFDTPSALFEQIMQVDPKRWKTLNGLGILFTTRNLNPEAQQYFNEALKFSPNNPSLINNLGLAQALDHQYDQAIQSLLQASSLSPAASAARRHIDLNLAMVYAVAGRLNDARSIAEIYLSGPELDNNLGLYAHLAKDDQMARAYLNMALTESKTFYSRAWDNLQSITGNEGTTERSPNSGNADSSSASRKKSSKKSQ